MTQVFLDGKIELRPGDCRDVIRAMPDNSIDSVVCDPPYALVSIVKRYGKEESHLHVKKGKDLETIAAAQYKRLAGGFMGKQWDTGETAFATEFWAEVLRVLKPGGHVVAFSGTRTYHRMAVAIEDAGFEIRDQLGYLYGSGFPKSHNVSRKLDGQRCTCARCETTEPVLQHDVRPVRDADVSSQEPIGSPSWEVLQSSLSEQGASVAGREQHAGNVRGQQPSMEGRSNVKAPKGKLRLGAICEVSPSSPVDVETGRLCDGTSESDGGMGGEATDTNGSRTPRGPQPAEQSAIELGTVAGQSEPQDGGAWPNCGRCGKPIIPDALGTALKPAWEPICLARKPLVGTVAGNVLAYQVGALNIDGCRVGAEGGTAFGRSADKSTTDSVGGYLNAKAGTPIDAGRWPANIVHDGSDEVVALFPDSKSTRSEVTSKPGAVYGAGAGLPSHTGIYGFDDSGSAARFFYTAKADKLDRIGSKHPTVKPVDLMQWLVRMVTPKGGLVLDPFAGSGSTGEAAWREGMRCILIEREEEYQADIAERLRLADKGPTTRKARAIKQADNDNLPLFGGTGTGGGRGEGRQIYGHFADQNGRQSGGGIMAGKGGFGFRIAQHKLRTAGAA